MAMSQQRVLAVARILGCGHMRYPNASDARSSLGCIELWTFRTQSRGSGYSYACNKRPYLILLNRNFLQRYSAVPSRHRTPTSIQDSQFYSHKLHQKIFEIYAKLPSSDLSAENYNAALFEFLHWIARNQPQHGDGRREQLPRTNETPTDHHANVFKLLDTLTHHVSPFINRQPIRYGSAPTSTLPVATRAETSSTWSAQEGLFVVQSFRNLQYKPKESFAASWIDWLKSEIHCMSRRALLHIPDHLRYLGIARMSPDLFATWSRCICENIPDMNMLDLVQLAERSNFMEDPELSSVWLNAAVKHISTASGFQLKLLADLVSDCKSLVSSHVPNSTINKFWTQWKQQCRLLIPVERSSRTFVNLLGPISQRHQAWDPNFLEEWNEAALARMPSFQLLDIVLMYKFYASMQKQGLISADNKQICKVLYEAIPILENKLNSADKVAGWDISDFTYSFGVLFSTKRGSKRRFQGSEEQATSISGSPEVSLTRLLSILGSHVSNCTMKPVQAGLALHGLQLMRGEVPSIHLTAFRNAVLKASLPDADSTSMWDPSSLVTSIWALGYMAKQCGSLPDPYKAAWLRAAEYWISWFSQFELSACLHGMRMLNMDLSPGMESKMLDKVSSTLSTFRTGDLVFLHCNYVGRLRRRFPPPLEERIHDRLLRTSLLELSDMELASLMFSFSTSGQEIPKKYQSLVANRLHARVDSMNAKNLCIVLLRLALMKEPIMNVWEGNFLQKWCHHMSRRTDIQYVLRSSLCRIIHTFRVFRGLPTPEFLRVWVRHMHIVFNRLNLNQVVAVLGTLGYLRREVPSKILMEIHLSVLDKFCHLTLPQATLLLAGVRMARYNKSLPQGMYSDDMELQNDWTLEEIEERALQTFRRELGKTVQIKQSNSSGTENRSSSAYAQEQIDFQDELDESQASWDDDPRGTSQPYPLFYHMLVTSTFRSHNEMPNGEDEYLQWSTEFADVVQGSTGASIASNDRRSRLLSSRTQRELSEALGLDISQEVNFPAPYHRYVDAGLAQLTNLENFTCCSQGSMMLFQRRHEGKASIPAERFDEDVGRKDKVVFCVEPVENWLRSVERSTESPSIPRLVREPHLNVTTYASDGQLLNGATLMAYDAMLKNGHVTRIVCIHPQEWIPIKGGSIDKLRKFVLNVLSH